MVSRIKHITQLGQSIWIDYISRELVDGGALQRLIEEDGVSGLTSNPAIFEKAIAHGREYRGALAAAVSRGERDPRRLFEELAFADIRRAADLLTPVYRASGGRDGYVSFEVAPRYAHDAEGTVVEAGRLWQAIDRPNLMIKVPATDAGLSAVEALTVAGINVNVTLLFSVAVYAEAARAYQRGLAARVQAGHDVSHLAGVASFFVSRIDTAIDAELDRRAREAAPTARDALLALRGRAAIACAKLAYARYREIFAGPHWEALAGRDAASQRLLWGSTGTKNPAYPDTLYVSELIGPDTVNTVPPATLDAFRDHGRAAPTLAQGMEAARAALGALAGTGICVEDVAAHLLQEGLALFEAADDRLIEAVAHARQAA